MAAVADYLDMPPVSVYEVATFYSMIYTKPAGPHKISVCKNISCMLCGGETILQHVEQSLGIKAGETTTDGQITLVQEEECLAACVGAPMMVVDGHYHEHLTTEKVDEILNKLKAQ
jgi:NADH-quinone oxidoreductase subunit E